MSKYNYSRGLRSITATGVLGAALLAAPAAVSQTTVISETWEAGSVGVINPLGGALSNGFTFSADNTWTVTPPTQDSGTGPHMKHEILEAGGSKWLAWQNDDVENGIDTQLFYSAPVTNSFVFGDVETITFSVDLSPTILSTGGRRSATFYVGANTEECYRFQINFRQGASELLTVSSITGGGNEEAVFGEPANFDDIAVDGVYTFNATITPNAAGTLVEMTFSEGATVIETGSVTFTPAQMLPLDTEVNTFVIRARQRTFQLWDNLLLQYTADGAVLIPGGGFEGPGAPVSGVLGLVLLVGTALVFGVAFARRRPVA